MPAKLSDTQMGYKNALDESRGRFEYEYKKRLRRGLIFMRHLLIKSYQYLIENLLERWYLKKKIEQFFAADEVRFAAIAGTLYLLRGERNG